MKKKTIRFAITLPILIVLAIICLLIYNYRYTPDISKQKADMALEFCKKHNLNTDYCIFVDFSKHAGKKRYVIYNLNTREVEYTSVCANGLNTRWSCCSISCSIPFRKKQCHTGKA